MANTPDTMDWSGNDLLFSGHKVATTTNTTTSSTAFTDVLGLKHRVEVGTYYIDGWINGSAAASGGIKVVFGTDSTATTTSCNISTWNYNGTTLNALTNITATTSNITANAAVFTDLLIKGYIVVSVPGFLQVQVTQNTSNATPTVVNVGSYIDFTRVT